MRALTRIECDTSLTSLSTLSSALSVSSVVQSNRRWNEKPDQNTSVWIECGGLSTCAASPATHSA